ncbi:MAG: hypothetical protein ACJAZO_003364 [Myxococcota bacterium]
MIVCLGLRIVIFIRRSAPIVAENVRLFSVGIDIDKIRYIFADLPVSGHDSGWDLLALICLRQVMFGHPSTTIERWKSSFEPS